MASTFPSAVATLTNPLANQKLNSPSHSSIESAQNTEVVQIQTFIGTESSAVGSLFYDVRAVNSNGGGHVQTANKGGTGQTSYTKGDILAASSSSVLGKLGVGANNQVLQADSTQTSGVKWSNVVASKVAVTTSIASETNGVPSILVLFVASIVGSTIGTNNAIRFKGTIDNLSVNDNNNRIDVQYGVTSIVSLSFNALNGGFINPYFGTVEGVIVGNGATNDQKVYASLNLINNAVVLTPGSACIFSLYKLGASSVETTANQDLIINFKTGGGAGGSSVTGTIFTVEKIQ